ncbi:MAG: hypothetical protein ABI321_02710 [Polyangia bacterium]
MEPVDAVLRFLESLGRRSEADFYLSLFRAEPKERFAAISVDANVARHATEAVTLDLRFLATLGLFPVVLLGLFDSKEAQEHATRIKRRLDSAGVASVILESDGQELAQAAIQATRAEKIPIITMVREMPEGPLTHVHIEERFARLAALLTALQTRKLIFLHRPGGLRQGGTLIPNVDLTNEYDALWQSKELSRKERAMLAQSRQLVLNTVAHKLLVTIGSPLDLLRELFTVKGAGTLLRRGAVIQLHQRFEGVDRDRLRALLTSAFGRPPDDGFFEREPSAVYLEENYRGAAVLKQTPLGAYLTKFAVGNEAQGEGIGSDLWRRLVNEQPTFFWRARPANPIAAWYTKQADGMVRTPDWLIFWKGLDPMLIPSAISYTLMQPIDIPRAME